MYLFWNALPCQLVSAEFWFQNKDRVLCAEQKIDTDRQVAFVWSQRPMHSQWKWCVQGRRYSSAPSTYGQRQIQHSYNIIRSSSVIFQQLHDAFQLYAKQQRIRASRFHVVTSLRQFSLQFSLCISGCNQVHFRKNPLPRILEHQLHNSQSLCLQFGSFLVHREWFRHELHH